MDTERRKAFLLKAGCLLLLAAGVYIAIRYLWGLLLPFLLGFAVAYMLRPISGFISRHSKMPGRWASIVSAIVFYALLALALWMLGLFFFFGIHRFGELLPEFYQNRLAPSLFAAEDKILSAVRRFFPGANTAQASQSFENALDGVLASVSTWGMELLGNLAKAVPMAALTVIFTILSSVLICADYDGVTAFVMRQIPARMHSTVLEVRDYLARSILNIIKTYLILMAVTFLLLLLGMWALRIGDFVSIAAVIAFLDLLPVLGSGAVLIPWGIILILTGQGTTGAGLLLLWAVVSFARQFLEPRVLGRQTGLHPLVALTAMYFGLRLAGFGGLILAPVVCLLVCFLQKKGVMRLYVDPD